MKQNTYWPNTAPRCLLGITLTAVLSLVLAGAIPAMADPVTYTYTGNDLTPGFTLFQPPVFFSGEYITASITLASPLDLPNQFYGLVDGGLVLTNPADCADLCGDVLAWSIGDATDSLSSANGNYLYQLVLQTDGAGQILDWTMDAYATGVNGYPFLFTTGSYTDEPGSQDYDISTALVDYNCCQQAIVNGEPGVWSEEGGTVPEPGTLTLLFAGLAAGALKQRKPTS